MMSRLRVREVQLTEHSQGEQLILELAFTDLLLFPLCKAADCLLTQNEFFGGIVKGPGGINSGKRSVYTCMSVFPLMSMTS